VRSYSRIDKINFVSVDQSGFDFRDLFDVRRLECFGSPAPLPLQVLRTALSNRLARVQGYLFKTAFLKQVPLFARLITENIVLCFSQSFIVSAPSFHTSVRCKGAWDSLSWCILCPRCRLRVFRGHLCVLNLVCGSFNESPRMIAEIHEGIVGLPTDP
jgi:hypothetical protein